MKKLFLCIILFGLSINLANALSESEQINAANFLATKQIINDFSGATDQYKINDNISRKEVMKIIMNIAKLKLLDTCEGKFKDVENDWGCKYIEKALNDGYVEKGVYFRPDDSITISETLKLIFKAKKIEKKYNTGDWGKDYINSAYDLGWIYDKDIDGNLEAKRGFIFLTLANAEYKFESFQEGKIEFKENKTDFYGIDFNLKTINSNKYELIGSNVNSDINSIEILSCKENFSDIYDSNWYNLKSFKNGNSFFNYTIDKNFNNYCKIPYKVKLNYILGDSKIVELNLNIPLFRNFTDKTLGGSGFIDIINLNTLKNLNHPYSINALIDKNNLYMSYFGPPAGYVGYNKIEDYLSYKYVGLILVGDNFAYNNIGEKSITIDGDTFQMYGTGYYKDKDNYYSIKNDYKHDLYKIGKNDKKLDILSKIVYVYDGKYYYFDKEFDVGDKDTFKIINNTEPEIYGYTIFAKDKYNIYFEEPYGKNYENNFKGDYDTFNVFQGNSYEHKIGIDKYSIYYSTNNYGDLKQYFYGFDLDSFKMEDDNLFSDKNGEYYLDEEKGIIKK